MQMKDKPNDLLLLAGKILTVLVQAIMVLVGGLLTVLLPVVLIFQDKIMTEIQADHAEVLSAFPAWPLAALFVLIIAVVALVFLFFGKLRAIISTVGEGDPFVPENADRLTLMAWLLLATQVLMIPVAGFGLMVAKWADEVENANVTIDAGLDIEGLLMVIVLFILARVFKHGAAMRDDLEGTV